MERNMQPVNTKMPLVNNNSVSAFLTSRGPVANPTQTFFGSPAENFSSRDKTFFTSKAITKFLAPLGKDKTKAILDYCLTPI